MKRVIWFILGLNVVLTSTFASAAEEKAPSGDDLRGYLGVTSGAADELLPPDQAFTASVSAQDADTLVAIFTPAKGYFLYRDKFVFRVRELAGVKVADVAIPRGTLKDDPIFGKTEVFHEPVRVLVRLKRENLSVRAITLYVRYQGCNEPLAVCYVPIEKDLRIALLPARLER